MSTNHDVIHSAVSAYEKQALETAIAKQQEAILQLQQQLAQIRQRHNARAIGDLFAKLERGVQA